MQNELQPQHNIWVALWSRDVVRMRQEKKKDGKIEICPVSPSAVAEQIFGADQGPGQLFLETGIWCTPVGTVLHEEGTTEGSNK